MAHRRDIRQRADDLLGGGKQVRFILRRAARRLHQPFVHIVDIEPRTLDALKDRDDGDGQKGECDPEEKFDAERPAPLSLRSPCPRDAAARGDPVAP